MRESVERLAASMLYEGYALYPYTPGVAKNATPTPFGIAYPPAYAARQRAAFDHTQVECVAVCEADARVEAAALFLQAAGSRHKAVERRVEPPRATVAELAEREIEERVAFEPATALGTATGTGIEAAHEVLSGTLSVRAERLAEGMSRITVRVENTTPIPDAAAAGMDRAEALRRSLLSAHTMLGVSSPGRFVSPLETEGASGEAVGECENVNTWPVLADPRDEAVLGAAVLLPDHPQIAAQSNVNMFDSTEIEEALTLHVQTLSDSERAEIAEQDPRVREMIERVEATTPEQLLGMHAQLQPGRPGEPPPESRIPQWAEPGSSPGGEQVPGEREVVVAGTAFRRGGKVVLRPGLDDPYDKMLDGQRATIHRIYLDYDGRAYIGVTVDADPMAAVLSESGRFLFFFADELEAG
jgi:hypothetical protein